MALLSGSFKGGIHPMRSARGGKRLSSDRPICEFVTDTVVIPMNMQLGAPCKPCVSVGETVLMGQPIGEPQGALGVPVHSSVSGTVTDVSPKIQLTGEPVDCITIQNDYSDTPHESIVARGSVDSLDPAEILSIIERSGIVGMGGAAFPTHVKLKVPEGKAVDTVILNGAECEAFLTADHRLMLEAPGKIIDGLRAAMRVLGVKRGIIAIEDNKPDAIKAMRRAVSSLDAIEVFTLRTKYPQGAEKQLIRATTGREIPQGALPFDAGVVVLNVATAASIAWAIEDGMPSIKRVTTVTGGVVEPRNLLLRVGTMFADAIGACGGYSAPPHSIIVGGPMMGISAPNDLVSVTKATNGIVVLVNKTARTAPESSCIRCAKCVETCPIGLSPYLLKHYCDKNDFTAAKAGNINDCINCGCCSYVCPARRHLTPAFKMAKEKLAKAARR